MADPSLRDELRDEAKRLYIDAHYTSRGHYKDAATQASLSNWFGVPMAIFGGLVATIGGAGAIFTDQDVVAGVIVLISAVLTNINGFMQPEKRTAAHAMKAGRYKAIRDDALFFLNIDLRTEASDDAMVRRLRELRQQYKELALVEPHLVSRAGYEKATEEIARGEASYKNDALWKELEDGGKDGSSGV